MYFRSTFRLLYLRKPNSGEGSSYFSISDRISGTPPVPLARISTSSRLAYLSRNL